MSHDLGAAAMRGRRTVLDVRWAEGRDGAVRASWCPIGAQALTLDVRRDGGRWRAVVERVNPRLRHEATDDTRDEAALWCEETAWAICCEEMGQ